MKLSAVLALSAFGMASFASAESVVGERSLQQGAGQINCDDINTLYQDLDFDDKDIEKCKKDPEKFKEKAEKEKAKAEEKAQKEKDKQKDKDKNGGGGGGGGAEAGGSVIAGCETQTGTCYAKNRCDKGATLAPIWLCMDSCFEIEVPASPEFPEGKVPFVYVLGGIEPAEGCNPGQFDFGFGKRNLRLPASAAKKEMANIVSPDNNRQFIRQEITISNEKTIPNPLN